MAAPVIPQTSIADQAAIAYAGMIADSGFDTYIESFETEEAVDAGYGVVTGATAETLVPIRRTFCKLPAAAGDVALFKGVVVYDPAKMVAAGATVRYAAKDVVKVLRRGRIWVPIIADVTIDGIAYLIYSGAGNIGKFNASTATSTAAAVPTGVWRATTTVAGQGLGLLEINLP